MSRFTLPANVDVDEVDLSTIIRQPNGLPMGIVVDADQGTASQTSNDAGLEAIGSGSEYVEVFGKPTTVTQLTAKRIAELADVSSVIPELYVKRALPKDTDGNITALWGGVEYNDSTATEQGLTSKSTGVEQPKENYTVPSEVTFALFAKDPNDDNDRIGIRVSDVNTSTDHGETEFTIEVYVKQNPNDSSFPAEPTEQHRVTLVETDQTIDSLGRQLFIEDRVNQDSDWILAIDNPTNNEDPVETSESQDPIPLGGGTSGDTPTAEDMVDAADTGFSDPQDAIIRLLINGGFANQSSPIFANKLWEIAAERKDCVAVLDQPLDASPDDIIEYIDPSTSNGLTVPGITRADSYASIYGPFYQDFEESRRKSVLFPGSATAARNIALTVNREGPQFAVMAKRGRVTAERLNQRFGKTDQRRLANEGFNFIKRDEAFGPAIWQQFTLQQFASATDRLNVRLTLIDIEQAISTFAKNFLGDLNDPQTRSQISGGIEDFLLEQQGARAIRDFGVDFSRGLNTDQVIANNSMVGNVNIIPSFATDVEIQLNFRIFSVGEQDQFGADFSEGEGAA